MTLLPTVQPSYRHVVADFYGGFFIQCVQHGAVLYVYTVADCDGVDIAAQHGIEPHAAFVAHCHVAHYGCVVGEEAVFTYFRSKSSYAFY